MPLTPDWATFFSAELGALAALTGFVVVAISINLSRILAYSWLPARAGEALIGPVGRHRDEPRSHPRAVGAASGFRNHLGGACDGRDADCSSGALVARA
jgi:hypothetical protein